MVFVLCILFNLALLCQGHKQSLGSSDGLGFGYPESEEENPSKKNAQVGWISIQKLRFIALVCKKHCMNNFIVRWI